MCAVVSARLLPAQDLLPAGGVPPHLLLGSHVSAAVLQTGQLQQLRGSLELLRSQAAVPGLRNGLRPRLRLPWWSAEGFVLQHRLQHGLQHRLQHRLCSELQCSGAQLQCSGPDLLCSGSGPRSHVLRPGSGPGPHVLRSGSGPGSHLLCSGSGSRSHVLCPGSGPGPHVLRSGSGPQLQRPRCDRLWPPCYPVWQQRLQHWLRQQQLRQQRQRLPDCSVHLSVADCLLRS